MSTKFEKISEFIDSLEKDSTLNDDQAYLLISGYGAAEATKVNKDCSNSICVGSSNSGICENGICF